jgi:serine/threonine-protein kinase
MPLTPGSRVAGYEITGVIGAGGMGEVYRAIDTRLGRAVALKVLPDTFTGDADRLARFEREAKTLATLNHPYIAHVYGLEETPTGRALVMELVDGEDLSERIARGAIPVDEALAIASQIAEAIEAAHEQGVVHRDLKPANIKVTPDGVVKVLDFGLAKTGATGPTGATGAMGAVRAPGTAGATGAASDLPSDSIALTSPAMTQLGMVLGTAAYMSPEQAQGRVADKRSDVWAFGCVLYEMLTGTRAFPGSDVVDTLAAVVRGEPDFSRWPAAAPPSIKTLVQACLTKDRRERISDIAAARYALRQTRRDQTAPEGATGTRTAAARGWWIAATAASTLAAAVLGFVLWTRSGPAESTKSVVRLSLVLPSEQPYWPSGVDRDFAITPDGSRIVYRTVSGMLAVRPLDSTTARTLPGTENSRGPFLSPDGQWVGFWSGGNIKKIPIAGGQVARVTQSSVAPRGHVWGADDTIVFGTNIGEGLRRVKAGGGDSERVTTLEPGEQGHMFPTLLPDGRTVLFTVFVGGADRTQIGAFDLQTRARRPVVLRVGAQPLYLDSGHLIYAVANTLQAVRFNLTTLAVVGDPVTVLDRVSTTNVASMSLDVARNGTLVYLSGGVEGADRSLAWADSAGRFTPIEGQKRTYVFPRLSPDGTRVVVDSRDQEQDIWIARTNGGVLTRLSFGPSMDAYPVWTPDGRTVLFASSRDGALAIFRQSADGTGEAARVRAGAAGEGLPLSVSPDAKFAIIRKSGDLWRLPLDGDAAAEVLMKTPATELNAEVSPDGRWLAFDSDESGQTEVYVRPFPNVMDGRWQISNSGGSKPAWSRRGKELFYEDSLGAIVSATYESTTGFSSGVPRKLFDAQTTFRGASSARTWDVGLDGRFLMVRDPSLDFSRPLTLNVILNASEVVKAQLPPLPSR